LSFASFSFLFLFLITLIARYSFGKDSSKETYLFFLLIASLVFYASYIPQYLFILLGITLADFLLARGIAAAGKQNSKKMFLALSIISNLGLLGFYKYYNFFVDELRDWSYVFDLHLLTRAELRIALPLGISFFTFESMSYTIDVYRGVIQPEKRYWRFLLFVSFFTHLISGPIVRAKELLYQFDRKREPRINVFVEGFYLIVRGYFLKVVVADNLADYVNGYWSYASGGSASPGFVLVMAILFACQIFADFEGYSCIARGAAFLLGFHLPLNFNNPYIAGTFKEFWSRWHMTLSRWMRDYLYIPLGGNRRAPIRNYCNVILVMLIAGFWHGANYTFIWWGGILGTAMVIERLVGFSELSGRVWWQRAIWYLIVQTVILISWIFFRAEFVDQALWMVRHLFTAPLGFSGMDLLLPGLPFCAPILLLHLNGLLVEKWGVKTVPWVKSLVSAFMLYAIFTLYGQGNAFLYFHF